MARGANINDEVRSGNSTPHYQVAYRDPHTGFVSIADDAWQPNKDRMQAESNSAMSAERVAAEKKRKTVDQTGGSIQGAFEAGRGLL